MAQKVTVLLEDETLERLAYYAYKQRENRCEIIRRGIEEWIQELDAKKKSSGWQVEKSK